MDGLWQMTIQIKVLQLFVHFIMCCCQSPQSLTWHEYQSTIYLPLSDISILSKVWDVSPCPNMVPPPSPHYRTWYCSQLTIFYTLDWKLSWNINCYKICLLTFANINRCYKYFSSFLLVSFARGSNTGNWMLWLDSIWIWTQTQPRVTDNIYYFLRIQTGTPQLTGFWIFTSVKCPMKK